jgi:riboflavin kinase/FMN adenylyltransferase
LKNYSILKYKKDITSITIGGFDGMHLAHQKLINQLDSNGAILIIDTGYANLTPRINRAKYSKYPLYFYDLKNIKHLNAKEFIKILNEEFINLRTIIIGFDFKFGVNASGNIARLKELFNGDVIVIDEFFHKKIAVHSRVIRNFLSQGDIIMANALLGRNYSINGIHIKGQGLGAKQFVATINIDVKYFLCPSQGIYATYTIVNNKKYKSATFIGHRVTTDGKFAIETHIIGETLQNINSEISIEFIEKIRDNKKFDTYSKLQKQILNDIYNIKCKLSSI